MTCVDIYMIAFIGGGAAMAIAMDIFYSIRKRKNRL